MQQKATKQLRRYVYRANSEGSRYEELPMHCGGPWAVGIDEEVQISWSDSEIRLGAPVLAKGVL